MSTSRNIRIRATLSLVLGATLSVLAYQNCSQFPAQQATVATSKTECGNPSGAPFPYDLEVDTIGYMSCVGRQKNTSDPMYFSVKATARRVGGVTLSSGFRTWASSNRVSQSKMECELQTNRIFSGAVVQASVRPPTDMFSFTTTPIGTGSEDTNIQHPYGPTSLGSGDTAGDLAYLGSGEYLNYINGRRIAAVSNLTYYTNEGAVKDDLANRGRFFLGFQGTHFSDDYSNRWRLIYSSHIDPYTVSYAYGRYFQLGWTQYPSAVGRGGYMQHGFRVLSYAQLRKVASSSEFNTYNCPYQAQYRIAGPGHNCNTAGSGPSGDPSDVEAYNAASAVLDINHWIIDQQNRCIIPRNGDLNGCYALNTTKPIQWGTGESDFCGDNSTKQCPHYFSICYK